MIGGDSDEFMSMFGQALARIHLRRMGKMSLVYQVCAAFLWTARNTSPNIHVVVKV